MSRYKIFQHYSLDTDIELTHRVISYGRLFFETYFKYIYIYIDTLEKHFPPSFFLLIRGKRNALGQGCVKTRIHGNNEF